VAAETRMRLLYELTLGTGQISPNWHFLQANHMSTSSQAESLVFSFWTLDDI
jgi:hypothetical protein